MRAPRAATPGGQPDDEQPVARRLSWTRLGLLSLVVTLVAGGSFVSVTDAVGRTNPETLAWSVPYVDVTLTPTFQFQDPSANPARTVALAFVVADPEDDCAPSWGGYYSLAQAGSDLELDRRIDQLRSAGGDVMVSLGGQANDQLAVACTDTDDLTGAYRGVVERDDLSAIHPDGRGRAGADQPAIARDVGGTAAAAQPAASRRAEALATVQREREADGSPLAVWLTVPVAPTGLTTEAVDLVRTTLAGGVELTGVNVMTMDYGDAKPASQSMMAATEQAIRSTVAQVRDLY